MAALAGKSAHLVWKEAGGYLGRPQVLDLRVPECHEFGSELVRFEVVQPGFAQLGDVRRAPLVADARFRRQ